MKNIFENAYFGKIYRLINGRKAVFIRGNFLAVREKARLAYLYLEPNDEMLQGIPPNVVS